MKRRIFALALTLILALSLLPAALASGDFMPDIPSGAGDAPDSGGDFMPDIPTKVEELPDPGRGLRIAPDVKELEVSQLDNETINGVLYRVYLYSFTHANLTAGDAAERNIYNTLLRNAGYEMTPLSGDSDNQYAISGGGYTAVLTLQPHDSIYVDSWWALYVPDGMPFTFDPDRSSGSSNLPFTPSSPFQNPSFF